MEREIRKKNITMKQINDEKREKDYETKEKISAIIKVPQIDFDEETEIEELNRKVQLRKK